ncbi:MAG TPA: crossover junction endodeoxyribonuclease RuvC [Caulobacteraceae bacterium]|nr:crossover junction endodeoxyribonuclease RuvC [Caulobacteraceae bacterium]
MGNVIRILGLDPGLRRTGWGVAQLEGGRLSHLGHGVIAPDERLPLAERLVTLFRGVTELIRRFDPHEAAVEETFATANGSSTLKLGQARAASVVAAAAAGLPVAEYAPKTVKKAVVGVGGADKKQVAFMVGRLMPAAGAMSADAADALAVAITHAHARAGRRAPAT